MSDYDEDEHVKEVYARFGLAVYCAQVLEHGLVNALVILDLIPNRRAHARSSAEWASFVDDFMGHRFDKKTMGGLLRELGSVTNVPEDLDERLQEALEKRNWLAHHFFRERASEFMTQPGRELMLEEVDECRGIFEAADQELEAVVGPVRQAAGLTDEMIGASYQAFLSGGQA